MSFEKFTNVYELSKTLRFELKPVGKTKQMLEEDNVFEVDRIIKEKYEKTKPYIDKLHREFIKEALTDVQLKGLDDYYLVWEEWYKDKKDKQLGKKLEKQEKNLRKEIVKIFDDKAKEWADKYDVKATNVNKLLCANDIFAVLKEKYGDDPDTKILNEDKTEKISIFDSWKNFTGYFTKFFETRKNFYKDDGTSTAIATRIVDQNLKRFCANILDYQKLRQDIDFSEAEQSLNIDLQNIFNVEYYNKCLEQTGIDYYNKILGGETLESGEKLKGVNEIVNQYRQTHKDKKYSFLTKLDKQILSEKDSFLDQIENDEELLELLKDYYCQSQKKVEQFSKLFVKFIENNQDYDLDKIYINKKAFNTISHRWTHNTFIWEKALYEVMKPDKIKGLKYSKKTDSYKFPDFISLEYIKKSLLNIENKENFWKEHYYEDIKEITEQTDNLWYGFIKIFGYEYNNLKERESERDGKKINISYDIAKNKFSDLLENFEVNVKNKQIIKDYVDSCLSIYQIAHYFSLEKKRKWKTEYELDKFYNQPDYGYLNFYDNAYDVFVKYYNKIRNYLTKKDYVQEKWKLNFNNSTLAAGWDKNKESDNHSVILRKGGNYYLAIMKKRFNKLFDDRNKDKYLCNNNETCYEKVVYKYFPGPSKMMPKVCFSKKGRNFFKPSQEIVDIYENKEYKKGDTFSLSSMWKLIDFYKNALTKYEGWECYDFNNLKDTKKYDENISGFYKDVSTDGYKIDFVNVSNDYIHQNNEDGKLYLFQIKNKDWNEGSTGKKNLHTLYFESLFSDKNKAKNYITKLNGEAELFFRPKTSKDKLGTRKDNLGKTVIKHKRFNRDMILFHVPMALNRAYNSKGGFNKQLNNYLAQNPDVNIIGIDRGEKHLAYYTVVDQNGKILESDTLNKINGVDYHKLLSERATKRESGRKNWQDLEDIKNLKKGYISHVVHKIADLVIKYNAIVVLEDLNMRFKQIRGGIEKSIYQQLEKALIDKFNYLVDKTEKDANQAGHFLKAYQLTAPFESFQKMGKQTGILFYTQASYTSKLDPLTGWRPNLYLKYSNAKKAKQNILTFDDIKYNSSQDRFELTYDLKSFMNSKNDYPEKTVWTLCTNVERFRWDKRLNNNKGGYIHYDDLTSEFKELFAKYEIDINKDIKEQIEKLESSGNENFFKTFMFLYRLLCQIRNTNQDEEGHENDFIYSPVEDENGKMFDSRDKIDGLPKNGDENGSYNIARKGIVILDKINEYYKEHGNCDKLGWKKLFISRVDWDNFVQK